MRYSIEPKFRKYVKGHCFLSFARKRNNKYGKNVMDTAKKSSSNNCRSYRRFNWK